MAMPVSTGLKLPTHSSDFPPNLAYVNTKSGRKSTIKLRNYFSADLFPDRIVQESPAIAEIKIFNEDGRQIHTSLEYLPVDCGLFLEIGSMLSHAGKNPDVSGAVCVRLVPEIVPSGLEGKKTSTEYLVEIRESDGGGSFCHNLAAPSPVPLRRKSPRVSLLCRSQVAQTVGLVFINSYHGPGLPLFSRGYARVEVWNHRFEQRVVFAGPVPRRGTKFFDFKAAIPDIDEFLDGQYGHFQVQNINLAPRGYIWTGCPKSKKLISLEHY